MSQVAKATILLIIGIILLFQSNLSNLYPGTVISNPRRSVRIFNFRKQKIEMLDRVYKTKKEWQELLSAESYKVTRKKATEEAFKNKYWKNKRSGIYKCICCGIDLFSSEHKYDAGTGYPSFWQPVSELNVILEKDESHFRKKTEVLCVRCRAHLGYVFDDGPPPTEKRYSINSAAVDFIEEK